MSQVGGMLIGRENTWSLTMRNEGFKRYDEDFRNIFKEEGIRSEYGKSSHGFRKGGKAKKKDNTGNTRNWNKSHSTKTQVIGDKEKIQRVH